MGLLSSNSPQTDRAVAIVGLGCRLPGAETPAELWKLLCEGVDATSEIPIDRRSYRQPGAFGRLITRRGGFVRQIEELRTQRR